MRRPLFAFVLLFFISINSFADAPQYYRVLRVVDGDTLVLEEVGKVRLLGVDTPETKDPRKPVQHFGKEASAFTKNLVEGKKVRLEKDSNKPDFFKRTLAYVYLEDGTFVNQKIIEQGYGHAYTKYPFSRMEAFRGFERKARETRAGLWADNPLKARAKALQAPAAILNSNASCVEKTCAQIQSCDEAKYLLNTCGFKKLDKDKNGVPCEKLCR